MFTPDKYIPRLSATIDYYHIKVTNAIIQVPEQAILDVCYTIEKNGTSTKRRPMSQVRPVTR